MWQAITRRKEDLRQQLPEEPDADHPDAVKILLKLPNGIRLERRFFKNDSLQVTQSTVCQNHKGYKWLKGCVALYAIWDHTVLPDR